MTTIMPTVAVFVKISVVVFMFFIINRISEGIKFYFPHDLLSLSVMTFGVPRWSL